MCGFPFWYRLTRVVSDKGLLNGCSNQCIMACVQCEWFFSSWDEDVYVPVDEETDEATPISSMNREMLAKAESLGTHIALSISLI